MSFIHVIEIVSRSGRVSAELGRMDIDSSSDTPGQVSNLVNRAYSKIFSPEKHEEMKDAILELLEKIEVTPGEGVCLTTSLKDGRTIRMKRILT